MCRTYISNYGIWMVKVIQWCILSYPINRISLWEGYTLVLINMSLWTILEGKNSGIFINLLENVVHITICSFYGKRKCPKRQFICFTAEQPLDHLKWPSTRSREGSFVCFVSCIIFSVPCVIKRGRGIVFCLQGCHGHGTVMDFLEFWNFLEFLEKSWNFD